jgi:hypothetical protein
MRELARHVRRTVSSLQRELDSLVNGGILRREHEGRHVYFQPDLDSPIFKELRELLMKSPAQQRLRDQRGREPHQRHANAE